MNELRILIIEDVPADAELEIRVLNRAGLRVVHRVVETEEAFREALREFQPELILSDYSPQHFDGMRALTLGRELVPDVPFIFVSGTLDEEHAIRALKNGATDYVIKNNLVRLPPAVERALQDVAARAAQRRAEQDRGRLVAIVENSNDAIISRDLNRKITSWNAAAERLFGYTAAEVIGRDSSLIVPSDREPEAVANRSRLMQGHPLLSYDSVRLTKDGRRIDVSVSQSPIKDAGGRINGVSLTYRDFSERKSQELKITRLSRIHAVLSGINSAIVRVSNRQELFNEACRIAVEHGNFGIAWIGMLDRKTLGVVPVACAGVEADSFIATSQNTARTDTPLGQGIVGRAIREKRAVYSNDMTAERSQGGARRQEAIRRGYRSIITFPLMVEDEAVGSLSLFAKEPNFFDDEEIKLLTDLAGDISFALKHIAGQEKIEKLSRVRAVSSEMNAAIVRIRGRQQLFEEACRIAQEHGKFAMAWIGVLDEATQAIRPVARAGRDEGYLEGLKLTIDPYVTRNLAMAVEAIGRGAPVICNDVATDGRMRPWRAAALQRGYRSMVMLPLLLGQRAVGVFALYSPETGIFDEEEMKLLVELAGDIAFALQTIEQQEKLDYLSYYDPLTGLPNRTLFNDRLEQRISAAQGDQKIFSVIMLDLERFRNINDSLGRQAGDDLLLQVGQRLKNALGETDILAHIGGDHFAIATRHADEGGNVAHFLEKIQTIVFGQPFEVGSNELRIASRAGVAVYPADGTDAGSLLGNTEAALKKAKALGERYLFYQPKMNAAVAQTLLLENKLRQALEKGQFVLHYQPKVDLAQGALIGFEALIRWNDPETGLVPPLRFIPLLEETGMILEAGRWAILKALEDYREWRGRGLQPPRIAVNVSPIQLRQKNFVDVVRDAIGASPDGPPGLDIEITESLIMEDIEGNIGKLHAVRDMGVNIAIDDFGTGYSSLGYLAKLPVNALKIDRSFIITMVKNADSMTIVSTIISLAHALNLKVIAEGVETEEQRNLLKLLKCDEMQGFLFSRPLPAAEVEAKFLVDY